MDQQQPVRIDTLASSGEGVGRMADGRVVFVDGGVPGDLVELADRVEGKRLVRARVGRIVEASVDRVEPRCAHFGVCGGCLWQQIDYPAQLLAKSRIVRDALVRIGGLEVAGEIGIEASPEPYAYRARTRLVEEEGRIGYRRRGSREIEVIDACPVLAPALEARRCELVADRATSPDAEVPARPPSRARRRARTIEWELVAGDAGEVAAGRVGHGTTGKEKDPGHRVELSVLGESLQASVSSFVQANAGLREPLAAWVLAQALEGFDEESASRRPPYFVELHAGIGFFTVPLARSGLSGMALESDRSALRDLRANLVRAQLANRVEVIGGRAERRGDLAKRLTRADLLLIDPPRTGLDTVIRETLARAGPSRIVYVSCDPATLARDLRFLVSEGGYRPQSWRAFDLFPQTPHVETVVRLERDASGSPRQGSIRPCRSA